jgi:hypothetical protein
LIAGKSIGDSCGPTGASAVDCVPASRGQSLPKPRGVSIAVLPFQNLSGDPQQEYFADGMVEEIITTLSRLAFNAHSPGGGSGLAQPVFRSPARIPPPEPSWGGRCAAPSKRKTLDVIKNQRPLVETGLRRPTVPVADDKDVIRR